MVKALIRRSSKTNRILIFTLLAAVLVFSCSVFIVCVNNKPIRIAEANGDVSEFPKIELTVHTDTTSHFGKIMRYSISSGQVKTDGHLIPVTYGYADKSAVEKLKRKNDLTSAEGVMSKFGSMLSFYNLNGQDVFMFDRGGDTVILKDSEEYVIEDMGECPIVDISDKYCLLRTEKKECMVNLDNMQSKIYSTADFDFDSYNLMNISLKKPIIVDGNTYISVMSDNEKSVLFVHFLRDGGHTVKTIDVSGRAVSITLDNGIITILTANVDTNDVFDKIDVFEAELPSPVDENTGIAAKFRGSTDFIEYPLIYMDNGGKRYNDCVFFSAHGYNDGKYNFKVMGINTETIKLECSQTFEELNSSAIYDCVFK